MRRVMEVLVAGFEIDVDGQAARLELVRCRNGFASMSPPRDRHFSNVLQLSHGASRHLVEVQVHQKAILDYHEESRARDHCDFLLLRLQDADERGGPAAELDAQLDERMSVFDEICRVPVLLSVLVCALADDQEKLPSGIFDLYEMGMLATLRRYSKDGDRVRSTMEMLQLIATANHLAKRRTFQPEDIRRALAGRSELLALWKELLDRGEVPLVKILTLGDVSGEFQFSHLSFQEALFGRTLESTESHAFWSSDTAVCERLNDPFYRNAFTLGRGHLGKALSAQRSAWDFDCQPRLTDLGRFGLKNLVAGAASLLRLDLMNVKLTDPEDMIALATALGDEGLPALEKLGLRWCHIPGAAAPSLGRFLARCPKLAELDLECNRDLLKLPEAAASLTGALGEVGLPALTKLSLRWCHIPAASGPGVGALLARCPVLSEADLLGNRHLVRGSLEASAPSGAELKGL